MNVKVSASHGPGPGADHVDAARGGRHGVCPCDPAAGIPAVDGERPAPFAPVAAGVPCQGWRPSTDSVTAVCSRIEPMTTQAEKQWIETRSLGREANLNLGTKSAPAAPAELSAPVHERAHPGYAGDRSLKP